MCSNYKREVTGIIACLREDRTFRANFRDRLHVAEAGYQSARERRWVSFGEGRKEQSRKLKGRFL
ncbi:hypothetical protein CFI03_008635 [Paenibacillus sp. ATY16]|nr:hypothetical protein [Paenibacillus sp. ATY16]